MRTILMIVLIKNGYYQFPKKETGLRMTVWHNKFKSGQSCVCFFEAAIFLGGASDSSLSVRSRPRSPKFFHRSTQFDVTSNRTTLTLASVDVSAVVGV